MTDTAIAELVTEGAFDDTTGQVGPEQRELIHSGRCRLQVRQVQPDVPTSGEHRYVLATIEVQWPVDTPDLPSDAVVTMTASQFDPRNVGRRFTVIAGLRKSQATAYRVQVAEVQG